MRAPKNRHSDPRKVHMPSFRLLMPVLVWCSVAAGGGAAWVAVSAMSVHLRRGWLVAGFQGPGEQAPRRQDPARHQPGPMEDEAVPEEGDADGRHQRPVRRRG